MHCSEQEDNLDGNDKCKIGAQEGRMQLIIRSYNRTLFIPGLI